MFDARIFLEGLENLRQAVCAHGFVLRGEYMIHDAIYASKDSTQGLDKVFLRLRSVPKNIWNEKPFIVSIKCTELRNIGKRSFIPVKEQFATELEAMDFIEKNYSRQFKFLFEFDRTGWQYDRGDYQIDLEQIEEFYSAEFKSTTTHGLMELLAMFGVRDVIVGPSVVAILGLLEFR